MQTVTLHPTPVPIEAEYDAIIIGGGYFGCSLALYLRNTMDRVLVLEMNADLLQRASYANQARVHNGYHYPRSILTALRSRVNFPRFIRDYSECIQKSFDKYYAISRGHSKVTATQYRLFMERIGAPVLPAPREIKELFNPDLIEDVFAVTEYAFDSVKLKEKVWRDLHNRQVDVSLLSEVVRVGGSSNFRIEVLCRHTDRRDELHGFEAGRVFNCTYSQINQVLVGSNLPMIPLKHELTEMVLVELPDHLRNLGITVMCGPFFSFMPFPPTPGLHTLSHVRYTPHHYWQDMSPATYMNAYEYFRRVPRNTNYVYMLKDAQRYLPSIESSRYVDSIWEVKTVLPQSEVDDSRPILFRKFPELPNFTCIMGGKIDNIYDVIFELDSLGSAGEIE